MIEWWQLHPMIAPLPRGFADEDTSHKKAKEWMNRATDRIDELEAALRRLAETDLTGIARAALEGKDEL
jgi:hypothetical protein